MAYIVRRCSDAPAIERCETSSVLPHGIKNKDTGTILCTEGNTVFEMSNVTNIGPTCYCADYMCNSHQMAIPDMSGLSDVRRDSVPLTTLKTPQLFHIKHQRLANGLEDSNSIQIGAVNTGQVPRHVHCTWLTLVLISLFIA